MWLHTLINWTGFLLCSSIFGFDALKIASRRKRPGKRGKENCQSISIVMPAMVLCFGIMAWALQSQYSRTSTHAGQGFYLISVLLVWALIIAILFFTTHLSFLEKSIVGMPCYYICWDEWVYFPEGMRAPLKWYHLGCVYPGILTRNVGRGLRTEIRYHGGPDSSPAQLYAVASDDAVCIKDCLNAFRAAGRFSTPAGMIQMIGRTHCSTPKGLELPDEWWRVIQRELVVKP